MSLFGGRHSLHRVVDIGCAHRWSDAQPWRVDRRCTLAAASAEKLYCVLAMQMGRPPKPMRVYSSICCSAFGRYSTLPAPYVSFAIRSIFSCAPVPGLRVMTHLCVRTRTCL